MVMLPQNGQPHMSSSSAVLVELRLAANDEVGSREEAEKKWRNLPEVRHTLVPQDCATADD